MEGRRELINRLNRAQGQIEALRKSLERDEELDCVKTIQLLKASLNALKKFGEAYVGQHLSECMARGGSKQEMEASLKDVVVSAFSL